MKRLVRSLGMEADTFSSGQAFIELIEATPTLLVDCVVLDVHMPGVNGLQVQEQLKKSGHRFPIVFITAHDDAVVRDQALAGGALAFLRKPFDDELLIETLRAALKDEAGVDKYHWVG
jgi:FixJ family two-component response regulator